MAKRMTLKQFEHKWRALLESDHDFFQDDISIGLNKESDPFTCASLEIPPSHTLVDHLADQVVEEWRELDERKISSHKDKGEINNLYQFHKKVACDQSGMPRWFVNPNRVRLPYNFDYTNQQSQPPSDDANGDDEYRVLSLDDPTNTTSYHQELWKLFSRVQTAEQVELNALNGARLPHMRQLREQLEQGEASKKANYWMGQLRVNDRHDVPPLVSSSPMVSSIRFECWRKSHQQLKPAPQIECVCPGEFRDQRFMVYTHFFVSCRCFLSPNRMSIEFLGSQTLLDFHRAIVELSSDTLWNSSLSEDSEPSSGYFLMEDSFYISGSVDYVKPLQRWLTSGTREQQRQVAAHLGLSPHTISSCNVIPMGHVRLEDLPLRLGVRYIHVHHGTVECNVFVVDRRWAKQSIVPYPILHDIWALPCSASPQCEACRHRTAVWVTSSTCTVTDGGPRFLCQACCRQLNVPDHEVVLHSTWKSRTSRESTTSDAHHVKRKRSAATI